MLVAAQDEERACDQPWLKYLDDDIRDFEKGSVDENATIVIRDVLAANSTSRAAIKEAALQLDKYDKDVRFSYDIMETVVNAACHIPYHDELQERLIQLLHELLETQTGPDYRETLSMQLEKQWNGRFPSLSSCVDDEASQAVVTQRCQKWTNFSAFKARTLVAGICADYEHWSFKAPSIDIPIGLNSRDDVRSGDEYTDCTLMVAAQYILIAGVPIKSRFTEIEDSGRGWNPVLWRQWAENFREASSWDRVEQRTRIAAEHAHQKMVDLWPELFEHPSGGQTTTSTSTQEQISQESTTH